MDIIVEVSANIFKKIMINGFLYVEFKRCYVSESVHIIRCYNCSGLGHYSKNCTVPKLICPKCTGEHKLVDCKATEMKCVNCINCNEKFKTHHNINHPANSPKCPAYHNLVESRKLNICYEAK